MHATDAAWADPPPLRPRAEDAPSTLASLGEAATFDPSAVRRPEPAPTTLVAWATLILRTPSPLHKVAYTRFAYEACAQGIPIGGGAWENGAWITPDSEQPPVWPPRMPDEQRVRPGDEGKRGKGGTERSRIAFFDDFCRVAYDEAKHFTLLQQRLLELGSWFGALPVHHGLWEAAIETSEDLFARLCTSTVLTQPLCTSCTRPGAWT